MTRQPRRKNDKPYKAQANLDVLFGEAETTASPQTVKLDAITMPQQQPRRYFDPQKLAQLTESIKAHGILENLLVRPVEGEEGLYELVAGERRYRAAQAAGLEEVPVAIRELTDSQALQISLIENLQREDLNPVEETEAILHLLASRLKIAVTEVSSLLYRMQNDVQRMNDNVIIQPEAETVKQVFAQLGLMSWESFVSNRLPLLKLPEDVLEALRSGEIEYTKAKAIAKVKDEQQRQAILAEAIRENLSLSEIGERLKTLQPQKVSSSSPKTQIQSISRRLNQSQLWEQDPKKWKQVQGWLQKIERLLEEG
ncbi:MAG: Chromosome-partitioning protein Spo0J [Chroococcidiopsis sp. SAG 2025]|uniref:ParB/RepB/Spo0J family partition protein n=1 Tax=Chroococcidiopsis sp. SAG 2025 TaxID=171389 RepID=UPI002936D8AA|nr:ParB/RepB/Spo0J family partition protein [Chroococcidiopsis sp. SAG 2025]MDV2997623.1 Chromosome-partitioning protein Spo0J [Chroococcidiopsis sp. SAG 2025]